MKHLFFGMFSVYARCFAGIMTMSFIEAACRMIQLGAFGTPPGIIYGLLEILVWGARVGIFLVILGNGNPLHWQKGVKQLEEYTKVPFAIAKVWLPVLFQIGLFSVFIYGLNVGGELLAQTIAEQRFASFLEKTEPIAFFFKNMAVIPFTLIFSYQAFVFIQRSATKHD